MCYEHSHDCKYCGKHYHCDLDNNICPTVNFDADKNMCDDCRNKLEQRLKEENENN